MRGEDAWPPRADAQVVRYAGIEIRPTGDPARLLHPPLTRGDVRAWWDPLPADSATPELRGAASLVGIDHRGPGLGDGVTGLGWSVAPLTPSATLVAALALHPGQSPLELEDDRGPALTLRTWRAAYQVSDYELAHPELRGSDLVMRPDLFERLRQMCADPLTLRDYLVGTTKLLGS